MTPLPITAAFHDGAEEVWSLEVSEQPPWRLKLLATDGREWESGGSSLFDSLRMLRVELEPLGIRVCCNGARINAHASRMSVDMGGGQRVYLLRLRKQARKRDLVDLFGKAPCDQVAVVADQDRFYEEWLASLG